MTRPLNMEHLEPIQRLQNYIYEENENYYRVGLFPDQINSLLDKLNDILNKNNEILQEVSDDATSSDIASNIAKLEEIRQELITANSHLNNISLTKATEVTLEACRLLLEQIKDNQAQFPDATQVEGQGETDANVDTNGVVVEIPFYHCAGVRRILVKHVLGNPQNYTIELFRMDPSHRNFDEDFDRIYKSTRFHTDNRKEDILKVQDIAFNTPTGEDKVWLRITPTQGTSNKFKYAIYGFKQVMF